MSGITSYRGFLYQQEVFFKILLEKLIGADDVKIGFEIADDVGVEEKLVNCKYLHELIQVKTGALIEEDFYKVFENWIISTDLKNYEKFSYKLFSEKTVNITVDSTFISNLKKDILEAKLADIRTIKRKAYEKIKKHDINKIDAILNFLKNNYTKIDGVDIERIKTEQFDIFNAKKCIDIYKDLEAPRKDRFDFVKGKVFHNLVEKIENKEGFEISSAGFDCICIEGYKKFGNDVYDPDYIVFRGGAVNKDIETILSENRTEVQQLKLAERNNEQIYEDILKELFYRRLLEYYKEKDENLILSTHLEAKDNYDVAKDEIEYNDKPLNAKNIYHVTTNKPIKSEIISKTFNSSFLQKGCYIHMTSAEVDKQIRIKWGDVKDENKEE